MPINVVFRFLFVAVCVWLSAGSIVAAQKESQGDPLEPGKTIERDLAGGESHSYLITLASGQFLHAIIAQRNTDLTATLFGPAGRQVGQFDGWWHGPEPVCYVAEVAGSYRLAIQPLSQSAARGSYQLRVEELRAPTLQDRTRVVALTAFTEGKRLMEQGGAQSLKLAKEKYEEALPFWRAIGDRFAEAETLNSLGFLSTNLEGSKKSLEYLSQALTIRQEIKDRDGEGETLHQIAFAHSRMGKKEQALEYYSRALPLRRDSGYHAGVAQTLGNMGIIHFSLGDARKAIEHYNQALPLWRAAGDRAGEVNTLVTMGSIHRTLGESQLALDYLHRGAQIAREVNDRRGEAYALLFLCRLYIELGEYEKALDFCGQALPLFRFLGDRSGEATALNQHGMINAFLGAKQKALDFYNQALSCFQAVGDRYNGASTLLNIGKLNDESGDRHAALDYYNQALTLFRDFKNPRGEALALNYLGSLYASLGEIQKGLDSHRLALPLWRALGDRSGEASTLANLARIQHGTGHGMRPDVDSDPRNLIEARHNIEAAITITESLRVKYASRQLRASYLGATQQYHELYIDLLMRLHRLQPSEGHDVSALRASERARARGLLEMLAEARADISAGIDASLLERERSLQKQINASAEYQYRLLSDRHTREQIEAAKRELDSLIDESRQVEAKVRETSPRYAELKYPQPLGLPEIQQMLDSETLLLEYSLGEERSYLWAVTPNTIESFELPKRAEIESLARQSYERLAAGESGAQLRARLAQPAAKTPEWATALSRILLGPVAARLGKKRLVIVADGALQYIPFAALPEPATGGRGDGGTGRRGDGEMGRQGDGAMERRGEEKKMNHQNSNADAGTEKSPRHPVAPSPRPSVAPSPRPSVAPSPRPSVAPSPRPSVAPSPRRPVAFTPLIANHEIVSLPSASSLAALRRELADRVQAPKIVAVIADPVFEEADERIKKNGGDVATLNNKQVAPSAAEPVVFRSALEVGATDAQQRLQRLMFSRREADEIAELAGAEGSFKALDFAANRATALDSNLSQYRIIHFATHGLLNSQHPELSGIVLSLVDEEGRPQDGFLRLHDIYNLRLAADLVVLSACKTGLGKEIKGEGLIGLTRGFLYAGAPRVVASLWKVDDRATAELIKLFYQRMLRDGLRPAAALRSAQIDMSKQPRWAAPYYWAGFTLQGEWK